MGRFRPTTKAQVSGHRFLWRRVEHGLVMKDIRMIHDPLVGRRRALIFGTVAVVMVAVGAGVLAWLQPNPRPGDAPIVRTAGDQLLVRVDGTYYPVANLTSARLIAGEPSQPAAVGRDALAVANFGPPLGIADAPGFLAETANANSSAASEWAVCRDHREEDPSAAATVVRAGDPERPSVPLGDDRAALVQEMGGDQWLITSRGRTRLPGAEDPLGRAVRRGLDIDTPGAAAAGVWEVPSEFLNAFAEQPEFALPDPLPEVWNAEDGTQWARSVDGVAELSDAEARVLAAAGAPTREARTTEVAALGDVPLPPTHLPPRVPRLVGTTEGWLCAAADGGAELSPAVGAVELSGTAIADRFAGLNEGAVVVDTGHSLHLVSPTGQRHLVPEPAALEALGVTISGTAPWEIVRLLPEGSSLDRDSALRVTY